MLRIPRPERCGQDDGNPPPDGLYKATEGRSRDLGNGLPEEWGKAKRPGRISAGGDCIPEDDDGQTVSQLYGKAAEDGEDFFPGKT